MDPHAGLNDLDYIVLGIVALSGLLALMRGFVREIFSLGAWVGAYFAAAKLYTHIEPSVHHYIKNPTAVTVISALSIFIFFLVLLSILGAFIASTIKGKALTSVDRSLGFLFGLFRGGLVVCLIYLGAEIILWPDLDKPDVVAQAVEKDKSDKDKLVKLPAPDWVLEARTRPALAYGAHQLREFIPQSQIEKTTQKYLEQKAAAQHVLDQENLDLLSTPTTASSKDEPKPVYDNKSRESMNELVNQKGTP